MCPIEVDGTEKERVTNWGALFWMTVAAISTAVAVNNPFAVVPVFAALQCVALLISSWGESMLAAQEK